jgi:AcrR family transcriptional regulator
MEARERILEKTHELFHQYGIRRVTMDDIATQCGMSKKTIYQYFKDKDELVDAVAESHIDHNKCICEIDKKQAKDALHEVFLAMDMVKEIFEKLHPGILHDLEKYHPKTFVKFRKHKDEFMYKVVKQNLEWGIEDGIYRSEIDIDVMTRFRLESMFLPFNLFVFPQSKYNIAKIEEELMLHFVYGLATIKGHKLIEKYKKQRQSN